MTLRNPQNMDEDDVSTFSANGGGGSITLSKRGRKSEDLLLQYKNEDFNLKLYFVIR